MNKVTFFYGKGGVGKSFLASAYADILNHRKNKKIVIVDADFTNPDLSRGWRGFESVLKADLTKEDGWIDLVDAISEHKDSEFIVSLPSHMCGSFMQHMDTYKKMLSEDGLKPELNMFFVMDQTEGSVIIADLTFSKFSNYFDNFDVILNSFFGREDEFLMWNKSNIKKEILKKGREIHFKSLPLFMSMKIAQHSCGAIAPSLLATKIPSRKFTEGCMLYIRHFLDSMENSFFNKTPPNKNNI